MDASTARKVAVPPPVRGSAAHSHEHLSAAGAAVPRGPSPVRPHVNVQYINWVFTFGYFFRARAGEGRGGGAVGGLHPLAARPGGVGGNGPEIRPFGRGRVPGSRHRSREARARGRN